MVRMVRLETTGNMKVSIWGNAVFGVGVSLGSGLGLGLRTWLGPTAIDRVIP